MIELYKAIYQARKKFAKVHKDATNPHFKSKYASLESVLDAVEDALTENKLLIYTAIDESIVKTVIVHTETGEFLESRYPLNPILTDQQKGSAISYARRYSIQSMLNLVAEDDDGNDAKKPTPIQMANGKLAEVKKWLETKPSKDKLKTAKTNWLKNESVFAEANMTDKHSEILDIIDKRLEEQ